MTSPGDATGGRAKPGGTGTARSLPGLLAAAALALSPAGMGGSGGEARAQSTPDWIEGQWFDPRLHRCGEVHLRITVDGDTYRIWQETYGETFPAAEGRILSRENGVLGVYNDSLGQTQQFRFVTPDAFVLERSENVGGATYVRCPGTGPAAPTG